MRLTLVLEFGEQTLDQEKYEIRGEEEMGEEIQKGKR